MPRGATAKKGRTQRDTAASGFGRWLEGFATFHMGTE